MGRRRRQATAPGALNAAGRTFSAWEGAREDQRLALAPDLEVQNARRVSGQTRHLIARNQLLPFFNEDFVIVGVGRQPRLVVLHDHEPAVSAQAGTRIDHLAPGGCAHSRARRGANVEPLVHALPGQCETLDDLPLKRPVPGHGSRWARGFARLCRSRR